jgi:hypothetical protein
MRAYIVFSGSGAILILTSCGCVTDPRLIEKFTRKGISKFIAYEVPVEHVQEVYGEPFEVVASDLAGREDVRVLDFNGYHIFNCFSMSELGSAVRYEH